MMTEIGNLKIALEKRIKNRHQYKLDMLPIKKDIEKLIEYLFVLLEKMEK